MLKRKRVLPNNVLFLQFPFNIILTSSDLVIIYGFEEVVVEDMSFDRVEGRVTLR